MLSLRFIPSLFLALTISLIRLRHALWLLLFAHFVVRSSVKALDITHGRFWSVVNVFLSYILYIFFMYILYDTWVLVNLFCIHIVVCWDERKLRVCVWMCPLVLEYKVFIQASGLACEVCVEVSLLCFLPTTVCEGADSVVCQVTMLPSFNSLWG